MSFLSKYQLGGIILEGETRTSNARDLSSGREVLVHELATGADRTRGTDLLRMIHRYLRSLPAKARNPILELGEHEGRMYLVTEAIPGFQSLRSWLEGSFAADASEPEAPNKSPLSVDPPRPASTSSQAALLGPAPADATAARTQVIKVAPGEWVFTTATPSPTPGPVGTGAGDITAIQPSPAIPSHADSPFQQDGSVEAVVGGAGRFRVSESWQAGSDDVTGARSSPANPGAAHSDVTMPTPLGSATGSMPGATDRFSGAGTGVFEAGPAMPSAGGGDVGSGDGEKKRAIDPDEVPRRPSAGPYRGWGDSLPPPSTTGEFNTVRGASRDAPGSERQSPPLPPSGKAGGAPAGEFTRLMQAAPAASPPGVPSDTRQSGASAQSVDFTRMFGGACAPSRPGDGSKQRTPRAFIDDSQAGGFASLAQTPSDTRPASLSSELPPEFGERPVGEFTRIFGAPGPDGFGPSSGAESYSKPGPGEFTQIFGREDQTPRLSGSPPGAAEPAFPLGAPSVQTAGSAPLPSAQKADSASSGAPKGALPEIKLPEVAGGEKLEKAPPAAPRLPSLGQLPKAPNLTPPLKPAVPAAPKLPAPPKIPVPPAASALKPKAPAKIGKPRKSSLPLILILGSLFAVAAGLVLYFALAGH